jgi:hypothetical protein
MRRDRLAVLVCLFAACGPELSDGVVARAKVPSGGVRTEILVARLRLIQRGAKRVPINFDHSISQHHLITLQRVHLSTRQRPTLKVIGLKGVNGRSQIPGMPEVPLKVTTPA